MEEKEKLLYIKETMENIAHQWRQPLAQINATVGSIDKILYRKNIQDIELEAKLQEIEALTKYMSNTIENFKAQLIHKSEIISIRIATIIYNAVDKVRANLREHSIQIETKIESDYECTCYENQLEEIVIVLLNNSRDALLDRNTFDAKIVVEVLLEDGMYRIKVSDNAGGITKSVMQKIFEPNYTTKHKSEGTGIGLYMAKKIVEKQNGTLSVKNVNSGSEFCISLPKRHQ